jgi:hypothetical protein
MTNHVHSVAIADRLDSIRLVFHRLNGTHSQRFNRKYKFVGHRWQERPFSCVPGESHLMNAIRYVENIPCARKWWIIAPTTPGRARPHIAADMKIPGSISNHHRLRFQTGGNG